MTSVKQTRAMVSIGALLLCTVICPQTTTAADKSGPVKILYIGNSYTSVNDLPKVVAVLAKAGGQRTIEFDRETPGGCTFEKHVKDGKAAQKINAKQWDYVVLQEQSQMPFVDPPRTIQYGKVLAAEAEKHGAKTLFYSTWARQNAPETQDKLTATYRALAKESKALIAPVGIAWQAVLKEDAEAGLHSADKSHPSPKGTYLAACVFYGAIYAKSPEGLPGTVANLNNADAKKLQVAAWQAVQAETGQK